MSDLCDSCAFGRSMCHALEDILSAGARQDVCEIEEGEVRTCRWFSERLEGSGGGN